MEIFYHFTDVHGGVSKKPFKSLNLAFHVGDDEKDVLKNREILKEKFNIKNLVFMNQVHGNEVLNVEDDKQILTCDALISDKKNLALGVMVADCIPLLLYDENSGVIAAVHAGRAGVFKKIARKTVEKMVEFYGINISDLKAVIGACIHQCCYEISGDVLEYSLKNYPDFVKNSHLDIKGILLKQLLDLGLEAKDESKCSCCNKSYFSYRRDGKTGRMAGVIMIRDENA